MSLKCGSVNLTKRVTLLSNASTLSFSSLGGRVALALLCLLAPVVLQAQQGPPPPPPDCPSCTIDVTALATGTVAASPTDPGWSVQYWVDASSAPPSYLYDQDEKPRDIRGLALSPTNQYLYAGYNTGHPDGSNGEVRKIDTTNPDPLDQTAVVAFLIGYRGKAIAVDDKSRVYLAEGRHENNDTGVPDTANRLVIYDSNLVTQLFNFTIGGANCLGTMAGNDCLPADARPEGVAVVRFDATRLTLYVSDRGRNTLDQFTLTESGSGISSALFEAEYSVPGAVSLRGVEVDKSGRIWIADPDAGKVFIVENTLTSNSSVLVPTAIDIGFDSVNAFVTQGPNPSGSTITVLSQTSPFAPVTTLTPPYAALNISTTANGLGFEPRLSGIAIACPLFGCSTPGFYVANEAAWTFAPNDDGSYDREPIIRANAGTVTPCPQGCGKVTGGGQIAIGTSGAKKSYANYGFNVQVKDGVAKGQLEYLDHTTGANYHSVKMTSLTVSPDFLTADFTGDIKKKGDPNTYTFSVHIEDHGEPGRDDRFEITISDGYAAGQSQTVAKGNIQIHRKCG